MERIAKAPQRKGIMKKILKKIFDHNEIILLFILMVITLGIGLHSPKFVSAENLFDILRSSSFIGILSVGFLFVLISGGIDISFTATATVAQYIMASVLASHHEMPVLLVILIPVIIGLLLGTLNAMLIHYLKSPPIIISIASLNAYYGIIQFASKGRWIYDFPDWFSRFPKILILQFESTEGFRYGLSVFTFIWIVMAVAGHIILRYTSLGRKLYASGGNIEAAKRAGINIRNIRWFVYAFLGGIAGIGALIHALITQTVAPNAILGQEFDVVTAVVLGGAAITGGSGTVAGSVLGVLLVAVIKNGLTLMKIPSYWHQVFIGGILLISIMATATRTRLAEKNTGGINVR
jgi:simple sugar transport system permease protein